MPRQTPVALDDHLAAFVERQVSMGRYETASDVVRAGLQLLEDRETRLEALRSALVEGERSGPPEPFDFDEFLARKRHPRLG